MSLPPRGKGPLGRAGVEPARRTECPYGREPVAALVALLALAVFAAVATAAGF